MPNEPKRFTKGVVLKNISDGPNPSDSNPTCNIPGHTWVIDTLTTQTAVVSCVANACDVFTLASHGLVNGQHVKVTTVACAIVTSPVNLLDVCDKAFVIGVCGSTFKLSTTLGGSAIAVTNCAGSVTLTVIEEQIQAYLCSSAEKIATDSNKITMTNKTLCAPILNCVTYTGTQEFEDDEFRLADTTDNTKKVEFDVTGTACVTGTIQTTFTTAKTVTMPDATDTLVGKATTDTLTNKTIDANGTGNSISNLEVADFAACVVDTALCTVSACDDTLASAKAIKAYADTKLGASSCVNHDCTTGFVANKHIDHSGVSVTAGSGLTGGGTIAATRTINVGAGDGIAVAACAVAVNITCATDKVTPIGADEILIADSAAAGAIKKADVASLSGSILHDCSSGFVANEHIDHSGVCIVAGAGLTGGGDISASRTINVIGTANEICVSACAVGISDNPTIPGTGGFVIPTGTTAQRGPCTAGNLRYNTTTGGFEGFTSTWGAIGGAGGGGGSFDIFYSCDFEACEVCGYTTGNNASFDGGGTVSGTLGTETSCQIAGTTSLEFTMGAASTNDWIASPTIAIDDKQSGNTLGIQGYYTYNGTDDDIKFVVFDDTCNEILTVATDFVKATTNPTRFSVQFPVPTSSTNLKWGFQVVTGNCGKIFRADDIEITTDPFVAKDLLLEQYARYEGIAGYGSVDTAIPYFTNLRKTTGSNLFTISNDSTNGFTITANRDIKLDVSFNSYHTSQIQAGLTLNSSELTTNIDSLTTTADRLTLEGANGQTINSSVSIDILKGDVIRPQTNKTNPASSKDRWIINVSATAQSCQIIAYNSRNAANSMVRLHTGNGHGSTNTKIRRFTTTVDNLGSAITYADSAADGASFTINEDGVYMVSYTDEAGASYDVYGASLNSTQLTTSICSITTVDRLGIATSANTTNANVTFSWSGLLTKNDVIRPHTRASAISASTKTQFTITKIGLSDLVGVPTPLPAKGTTDTFYFEDFEPCSICLFTSGNNATFDNGGSLAGTTSRETVCYISGSSSFEYIMDCCTAGNHVNDWIASPTIPIDDKQSGNTIGIQGYYTYSGADDDIKIVIFDDTCNEVLTLATDYFKVASNPKRFSVQAPVPSCSTNLKWGFQVVSATACAIFRVDDVELTSSPFVAKNLLEITDWKDFTPTASSGFGTLTDSSGRWRRIGDSMEVDLHFKGGTVTTAVSSVDLPSGYLIDFTKIGAASDNFLGMGTQRNSSADYPGTDNRLYVISSDNIDNSLVFLNPQVSASDTFNYALATSSWVGSNAGQGMRFTVPICGWSAQSCQIIAYNSRNAANSMVRLHTGNGHGSTNTVIRRFTTEVTNTGNAITYTDSAADGASFAINEDGVYMVSFTDGRSGSLTFLGVSLNSSQLTTSIASITSADSLGYEYTSTATVANSFAWSGILTKGDIIRPHGNGTADLTTGETKFTITKIGVGDLLGVPLPITGYLKDVKSSGTNGGTATSGSFQTRTLNTEEGCFSKFGTLACNQFTLDAGTYHIEASAPGYDVASHKTKLRNITDCSDDIIGRSAYSDSANCVETVSMIIGTISITATKTFEIQHRVQTTKATNGHGVASSFSVSEIYTQVKITKIS